MFRAVIPGPLTKKFTNIIVMSSNPRSGSSYTGELLSGGDRSNLLTVRLNSWVCDNKSEMDPKELIFMVVSKDYQIFF